MDECILQLLRGQLLLNKLPARLDLTPVWESLEKLCHKSLMVPGNRHFLPSLVDGQVEWGSCLVLRNGEESVHLFHQNPGSVEDVDRHPSCFATDHTPPVYAGFAHTHLPVRGKPHPPGFSAGDYDVTLADGDNLALVCNGPSVFALARIADFTEPRRVPDDTELNRWKELYKTAFADTKMVSASDPNTRVFGSDAVSVALWKVNQQMCEDLGFAFYLGAWGQPLDLVYQPPQRRRRGIAP
jgi:hypothetical protein